jgi:hypothetical protein
MLITVFLNTYISHGRRDLSTPLIIIIGVDAPKPNAIKKEINCPPLNNYKIIIAQEYSSEYFFFMPQHFLAKMCYSVCKETEDFPVRSSAKDDRTMGLSWDNLDANLAILYIERFIVIIFFL